jgi:Ca2+-transporting ATPase
MERKPRREDEPILDRLRFAWIAISGLVMAAMTIGLAKWAEDNHGNAVARTMAMTTFAIANLLFSFTALDEKRTIFSLDTVSDRKFLMFSGLSAAAIFLGTELGPLNRILQTVPLDRAEWGVCLVLPLTVVGASEIWKWYLRRRDESG